MTKNSLPPLFDTGYVDLTPILLSRPSHHAVKAHYVNVLLTREAGAAPDLLRQEGRVPLLRQSLLAHPWQPLLNGYGIRHFAGLFAAVPNGFFVITDPEIGKDLPHCREIDLGAQTVAPRSPSRLARWARSRAVWRTWIGTSGSHSDRVRYPPCSV